MRTNFRACLDLTLSYEGGFVNRLEDRGGPTNRGITLATLSHWRGYQCTATDVQEMPEEEARQIYASLYWNPIRGDDLPVGIDAIVFDAAVHHGVRRSSRWLQEAVGASVDGYIGQQTLLWVLRASNFLDVVRVSLLEKRAEFMRSLPDYPTFGVGWLNRVERLRGVAQQMMGGK